MKQLLNFFTAGVVFRLQLLSLIFVFNGNRVNSQCTNQVTHLSGMKIINGVNVTVTSTGTVDSNFVYCPATFPYFVGYHYAGGQSGNGSYLFNFSPPVSSVTLNFSGISNIPAVGVEEIKLKKNGTHYSIPAAGISNGCDALAVLTPEGDIAGCSGCGVSGWKLTTVPGPVSSIEIVDTVISLAPAGTIFSLFICDIYTGIDEIQSETQLRIFPNPFINTLSLSSTSDKQLQFILYDIVSRRLMQQNFIRSASLNTEQLSKGIYLYEIKDKNNTIRTGKIIKE